MRNSRTSWTSPLQIAQVAVGPGAGYLGLTICPGKKDSAADWDRDLRSDVEAIHVWGASMVVTLIEDHEFRLLAVEHLEREVCRLGMVWLHLPILDVSVPDLDFEERWETAGKDLHRRLDAGEHILIHCRGGLGRTGLVAGRILVERGYEPQRAVQQIRAVRPHAIETRAQEAYVFATARPSDAGRRG